MAEPSRPVNWLRTIIPGTPSASFESWQATQPEPSMNFGLAEGICDRV